MSTPLNPTTSPQTVAPIPTVEVCTYKHSDHRNIVAVAAMKHRLGTALRDLFDEP